MDQPHATMDEVAGLRTHRGAVHGEAAWPAILDRNEWERLGALLRKRGATSAARATNTRKYLLSGWALCGVCGQTLKGQRHSPRRGQPDLYRYTCTGRHAGRVVAHLDDYVSGAAAGRARRADAAGPMAALDALLARRTALLAEFADDGVLTPAELRGMVQALDVQVATAQKAVDAAATAGQVPGPVTRDEWDALPLSRKRAILAALFEPLVLHPSLLRGNKGFNPIGVVLQPHTS